MSDERSHIAVLGSGAFGCAIAHLLAHNGRRVVIWCLEEEVAEEINRVHLNSRFLPDMVLPPSVSASPDMGEVVRGAEWIVEAVPVKFLRSVVCQAAPHVQRGTPWAVLSKGMEHGTLLLPSEVVDAAMLEAAGFQVQHKVVMAGPNFALDIVAGRVSGTCVASSEAELTQRFRSLVACDYFCVCCSDDVRGVQVSSALKNVVALAVGIARGQNASDNTVALLLTRGLCEMGAFVERLGGMRGTTYGLAGFGDLAATCMGSLSKNVSAGTALGSGVALAELERTRVLPEGINTVKALYEMAVREGLAVPLVTATYQFVFESASFDRMLQSVVRECR